MASTTTEEPKKDEEETTTKKKIYWLPLESNPAMLNEFAYRVGMNKKFAFNDVWGLDDGLTAMLPRPCYALTLLFNPSDKIKEFKAAQQKDIEDGKVENKISDKVFYMKQYVGNACGTIATLHSIANAPQIRESLTENAPIGKFFNLCDGKNQDERGLILGEADYLSEASDNSATNTDNAQTSAPQRGEGVNAHFIAFVPCDGCVYELDGGKAFPINHGPIGDDFIQTASKIIQSKFMQVDPDSYHWNIMALCEGRGGGTQTPEFLKLNPSGLIPFLVDNVDNGPPVLLGESSAILTYLGDRYGQDIQFTPKFNTQNRYTYDQLMSELLHNVGIPLELSLVKVLGGMDLGAKLDGWLEQRFERYIHVLNDRLERNPSGWLNGENFSAIDIMYAHTLQWAQMFKMKNIPDASLRYLRKCQARPAYIKALEAVPDIFHGGEENPIKNSKM